MGRTDWCTIRMLASTMTARVLLFIAYANANANDGEHFFTYADANANDGEHFFTYADAADDTDANAYLVVTDHANANTNDSTNVITDFCEPGPFERQLHAVGCCRHGNRS